MDGEREGASGLEEPLFPTGASSGLGARFARVARAAGATVIVAARRLDRLTALVGEERRIARQNMLVGLAVDEYGDERGTGDFLVRNVLGIDNDDRNGFFIGRNLKPIQLSSNFQFDLQPQVLVQRAIDGQTNNYIAPGSAVGSGTVTQPISAGDAFGLEAELSGRVWGWKTSLNADLSTLNPDNLDNGSRYWGELKNAVGLPWLGNVKTRLFGAYRYRTWNGSLGQTDVYSAFGGFANRKVPGSGASWPTTISGASASATTRLKPSKAQTSPTSGGRMSTPQ